MPDNNKTPEPDLLLLLDDLRLRLINKEGYSDLVEQYKYFITHSEYGKDCQYARKAKDIWLKYDYNDIKTLFLLILEQYRVIEGQDFGR